MLLGGAAIAGTTGLSTQQARTAAPVGVASGVPSEGTSLSFARADHVHPGTVTSVKEFGATGNGTTDDTAAFVAAFAAVPTAGGEIYIPAGTYKISSSLTIASPVFLHGASAGIGTGGSQLNFSAGTTGITIATAAQMSRVENLYLKSASTTLGTDDGIRVFGHGFRLENIVVDGFGRYGISTDTRATGNADNSYYTSVRAVGNKSHGFYTVGTDSNAMTFIGDDATANSGYGFYDASAHNTYVEDHADSNTGGAWYLNGISTAIYSPYVESSASPSVLFDTGSSSCYWNGSNYGGGTITDSGGGNEVRYYTGTPAGVGASRVVIGPRPQVSAPSYLFQVGVYNGSALSLSDQTNSANIFEYDTINHFQFLQKARFGLNGIDGDGPGYKHKRVAGCLTAGSLAATCTTTITWGTAFADSNYSAICVGDLITSGIPISGGLTSKSASAIIFQTVSGTISAAQYTTIDCIAVHD